MKQLMPIFTWHGLIINQPYWAWETKFIIQKQTVLAGTQLTFSRLRAAFLTGGLVWAALLTYLVHGFGFTWFIAITDGIVSTLLLGAACWLINNNLRYFQPGKGSYINILTWCGALALACAFGSRWILPYVTSSSVYSNFVIQSVTIRLFTDFLAIGWMAMISMIYYSQLDQKENENRKAEAENLPAMPNCITFASNCSRTFCLTVWTPLMRWLALNPTRHVRWYTSYQTFCAVP